MSREKFEAIHREMELRFINREEEIEGLTLATLSGQHVVYLGPPGNAKTAMVRLYSHYLNCSWFSWLLTKYSTPDELFGPVDIKAMKEGHFRRVTSDKLPEAEVAFLDEVFKANSAILNSMLSVLQERTYHNNGQPQPVPLIFAAGASNELPDPEEGTSALYDRFLLRYNPGYLSNRPQLREMLTLDPNWVPSVEPIDRDDLMQDIAEVKALPVSDDAIESMEFLWEAAKEKGLIASDRRYKQMLSVMAAKSWLMGEREVVAESLEVAEHILWDRPEQIRDVKILVKRCVNPTNARAEELLLAAREAKEKLETSPSVDSQEILQVVRQLTQIQKDMGNLRQSAYVKKSYDEVTKIHSELLSEMLGGKADTINAQFKVQ